jgi:hypothetical protein
MDFQWIEDMDSLDKLCVMYAKLEANVWVWKPKLGVWK